jgi:hypothetical protein
MAMFMNMASVSFSLPGDLVRRLDAVAKAEDRSRSSAARGIPEAGLPETAVPPPAVAAGTGFVVGAGPAAQFQKEI